MGPAAFKAALATFPSGVTIVTTRDATGVPHGFTASAFCSVSLDPPLIAVCLARAARCHPVFAAREEFAVSILRPEHTDLALRFAGPSTDKFADGGFEHTDGGPVVVEDALAVLECSVHTRHEAGDHTILIGAVRRARARTGPPLVFHSRAFGTVTTGERVW